MRLDICTLRRLVSRWWAGIVHREDERVSDERPGSAGRSGRESTDPFQSAETADDAGEVRVSWSEVIGGGAPAAVPQCHLFWNQKK